MASHASGDKQAIQHPHSMNIPINGHATRFDALLRHNKVLSIKIQLRALATFRNPYCIIKPVSWSHLIVFLAIQ